MRIVIVGTGYVGLVTAAGFAEFGNEVVAVDINQPRIDQLNDGKVLFFEPGLEERVRRRLASKHLSFTTSYEEAFALCPDAVFLAVGTPEGASGAADRSFLFAAVRPVGEKLSNIQKGPGPVVVIKSTVPPGTAAKVLGILVEAGAPWVQVASNPEFLAEGTACADFEKPARVVIGTRPEDSHVRAVLTDLYRPIVVDPTRILYMDWASAELSKYAANAMLASRVAVMNELALVAEGVHADIDHVRHVVGSDPRIGPKFLYAGPGTGGSCFAKDLRALNAVREETGRADRPSVLDHIDASNEFHKGVVPARIFQHFLKKKVDLRDLTVAVWGLAFKPGTDDVRESSSLHLVDALLRVGAKVKVFDPRANETFSRQVKIDYWKHLPKDGKQASLDGLAVLDVPGFTVAGSAYEAAEGADALVLMTEWHEFRAPDFAYLQKILKQPVLIDARNIWDPGELRARGFTYYGMGRP